VNYLALPAAIVGISFAASAILQQEDTPPTSIAEILFQAGVVGAFIVFAVLRGKQEADERDKRAKAMDDERARWVTFLDEERKQRAEAMRHGMDAVKEVGGAIGKIDEHLSAANLRGEERHTALIGALASLAPREIRRKKSK
jgi:hypothetical protein